MNIPLQIIVNAAELSSPEALGELQEKLADFAPVLAEMATAIEQGLLENFESQGQGEWPSLSPYTLLEKETHGFQATTEVREGRLKAALTVHDAPGHVCIIDNNSVSVGVDSAVIPYFNTQNFGDTERGIPARIMLQVSEDTIEKMIEIVTEWIGGGDAVRVYAL